MFFKKLILGSLILVLSTNVLAKGFSGGRASHFGSRSHFSSSKSSSVSLSNRTSSRPTSLYASFKEKNTISSSSQKVIASDINKIFDRNYRTSRRQQYYSGYSTPSYAQPIIVNHPNYGMWDALMMWSILDNMGDRQMYYHHQDDQAFKQWRSDANQLCNLGNKEICDKLTDLDKDINELQSKGTKKDVSYITEGIDPNIYTSQTADINSLSEVKICTGSTSSDYSRFAQQLASETKLKIKNISSNGSIDNLIKLSKGECDLAFVQSDAITSDELVSSFKLDTKETAMLICNKEAKVKSLTDLTNKHTIYVGSDQSGSQYTLSNFISKLDGFNNVIVDSTKLTIEASLQISRDINSCFFAVDTIDAPYVTQLNKENVGRFVEIDQKIPNYLNTSIIKGHANLTGHSDKGFFSKLFGTNVKMLAVEPTLVTTKSWIENNSVTYYDVLIDDRAALKEDLK